VTEEAPIQEYCPASDLFVPTQNFPTWDDWSI
jgi:hypothetical protein